MLNDLEKYLEEEKFKKRKSKNKADDRPSLKAEKPRDRRPLSDILSGMRRYYRGGKV